MSTSSFDPQWVDDHMALADAVGVTRPEPIHPSVRSHLGDEHLAETLRLWSSAAAGIDVDEPIPFTLVLDHAPCQGDDCEQTICCCITGPCADTVEQACPHHNLLCHEHRLDCTDCVRDFVDDGPGWL